MTEIKQKTLFYNEKERQLIKNEMNENNMILNYFKKQKRVYIYNIKKLIKKNIKLKLKYNKTL